MMTIAVYARNTKDNNPNYLETLSAQSVKESFKVIGDGWKLLYRINKSCRRLNGYNRSKIC